MLIRGVVLAAVTGALTGCGSGGGTVSLVLDIPNGMLDPQGYSDVELRLHGASGDTELTARVNGGTFQLADIEVAPDVLVEASLRTEAGATVGYGRAAAPSDIADKSMIVIPVRRPLVYIGGLINVDQDGDASTNDVLWTVSRPTFSDLSVNKPLDGTAKLADPMLQMVAAGPRLFAIGQQPQSPSGTLSGPITIREYSTADHSAGAMVSATGLDGIVADAAGSDDGKQILLATSTHLFVIDTTTGATKPIADGSFARVAIVAAADRALTAIAIRNRTTSACTGELVWALVNADDTNQTMTVGTSGYADVAGDNGRAFYVDTCKTGELGEATASGTTMLRTGLGKPTAVAVSNGQAWIGIEKTGGMQLIAAPLAGSEMPRTLFDEAASLVVEAFDYKGVQRNMDATSVTFKGLEVGAGGDYVATTIAATFSAAREFNAFPRLEYESEELRIVDTATGAAVQRYRSWCDGVQYIVDQVQDIYPWFCTVGPGQSAPTDINLEHHISGMTFQFGKK